MRTCLAISIVLYVALIGCGESYDYRSPRGEGVDEGKIAEELRLKPTQDFVMRGRVMFKLNTVAERVALGKATSIDDASESFKLAAIVRSNVQFGVNDDMLIIPTELDSEIVDFGSYQVNELRDNDMNVCGRTRRERCREAVLRVYSLGTPKAGLWNTRDEYGAPLSTAEKNIGLGAEQAADVAIYTIPANKRVLQLKDFTGSNSKPIVVPVSADFSDAGAGDYQSEILLEYGLR